MEAYVPLIQTLAWVTFGAVILAVVRKPIVAILYETQGRIRAGGGAEFSLPWMSARLEGLTDLPRLRPTPPARLADDSAEAAVADTDIPDALPDPGTPNAELVWNRYRNGTKNRFHHIYLAHVIGPTAHKGQKFNIYVYLVASGDGDLSNVVRAEFFLGPYWGNKIFVIENENGRIGFSTAAYGSPLCICKVIYGDGSTSIIYRYLDFEMAQLVGESGAG